MRLKCSINGKQYKIVQGATFKEEYNETLDSGSIIIDQVPKIQDLRPYDDVFVYNVDDAEDESEEQDIFNGYRNTSAQFLTFLAETDVEQKTIRIFWGDMAEIFNNTSQDDIEQNIDLIYQISQYSAKTTVKANFTYNQELDRYTLSFKPNDALIPYQITVLRSGSYYVFSYDGTFGDGILNPQISFEAMAFGDVKIYKKWGSLEMPSFYKHLLVYQYSEERLSPTSNLYKYKIELCSETKKLETIQLPNISITQPLNINLKKSVYDYAVQFLDMYNSKIKMRSSFYSRQWTYTNKYSLSQELEEIFSDVYCPDFTLDNPSLKDVLHQLFLTKDRIPVVKDDTIYALDITERRGDFNTKGVYSISGSMSLDNYADSLKRTYQNALSGYKTARRVEYLGFRNSSNALMTLGNMRLETKFPIYKINKIYMCYYKRCEIHKIVDGERQVVDYKIFLCKQDITPLVKLNQERDLLSEDWSHQTSGNKPSGSDCVEEMAQYKLYTVGYDIGGTTIDGWGTKYTYPKGWFDVDKTYIENIFEILDRNFQFGIYTYGYVAQKLKEGEIITTDYDPEPITNVVSPFGSGASKLKSFVFEVEYEAFYNGTTITSKDDVRDDIVINDNSSSALTLLEKDGLFQKEKANRFGNMAYSIRANYDTIDDLQELGSVYDDDVIIYSREYQIWDNIVRASYSGTKDYVLKNYYTSVYAKHRPTALMDYGQSTKRAENRKMYVMLSKNNLYYENENNNEVEMPLNFNSFTNGSFLSKIVSFCKPNQKVESIDAFIFEDKINYGYVEKTTTIGGVSSKKRYATDLNVFVNGYSLCFNLSMWDNITMGNYIEVANPDFSDGITDVDDDYTGSTQNFYGVIDDTRTGFAENLGFYVCSIPKNNYDDMVIEDANTSANDIWDKLLALPLISNSALIDEKNIIGREYKINKDNKEVIDMTFQIEPFTDDNDILFSEWMIKLSDLFGIYNKVAEDYTCVDVDGYSLTLNLYCSSLRIGAFGQWSASPMFIIEIPRNVFSSLVQGKNVLAYYVMDRDRMPAIEEWFQWTVVRYEIRFKSIENILADQIQFRCVEILTYRKGLWGGNETQTRERVKTFVSTTNINGMTLDNVNNYYFVNFHHNNVGTIYWEINEGSGFPINYSGYNCLGDKVVYTHEDETLSFNKFDDTDLMVSTPTPVEQPYSQNLFIKLDENEIKKTLVYDEYKQEDISFSNLKIDEVINVITSEETTQLLNENYSYLFIDLSQVPNTTKSLQVWFDDSGTYRFVFGVNISQEDFSKGHIKVYLSLLSRKDTRVFNNNHIQIGKIRNFADDDLEEYGFNQYYDVVPNN